MLTRREFNVLLAGTSSAIAGFFLIGGRTASAARSGEGRVASAHPRLRTGASWQRAGDGSSRLTVGEGDSMTLCSTNRTGTEIIASLDGHRDIRQIAARTAQRLGVPRSEAFEAQIATFVAEVASLGFLADPFYVHIVERTASA